MRHGHPPLTGNLKGDIVIDTGQNASNPGIIELAVAGCNPAPGITAATSAHDPELWAAWYIGSAAHPMTAVPSPCPCRRTWPISPKSTCSPTIPQTPGLDDFAQVHGRYSAGPPKVNHRAYRKPSGKAASPDVRASGSAVRHELRTVRDAGTHLPQQRQLPTVSAVSASSGPPV